MLVLTRKTDETIRIGDDIVIKVLRSKGKAVRLGIEAPADKRVLRGEIAFDVETDEQGTPQDEAQCIALRSRVSRGKIRKALPILANPQAPLADFVAAAQ